MECEPHVKVPSIVFKTIVEREAKSVIELCVNFFSEPSGLLDDARSSFVKLTVMLRTADFQTSGTVKIMDDEQLGQRLGIRSLKNIVDARQFQHRMLLMTSSVIFASPAFSTDMKNQDFISCWADHMVDTQPAVEVVDAMKAISDASRAVAIPTSKLQASLTPIEFGDL